MYKLIATTALVAVTASSASAWDGASNLVTNLSAVYESTNLQNGGTTGTEAFDALQYKDGALSNFLDSVNQGVSYVTLTVEADNTITPAIKAGTTAGNIDGLALALVAKVQTDLFGAAENPSDPTFTDNSDTSETPVVVVEGGGAENGGLFGLKIDEMVTHANNLNIGLIDGTIDATAITADFTAFGTEGADTTGANATVANLFGSSSDLNEGIRAASGSGGFFSNVNDFTGSATQAYAISGFTPVEKDVTKFTYAGTEYASLLAWAEANP